MSGHRRESPNPSGSRGNTRPWSGNYQPPNSNYNGWDDNTQRDYDRNNRGPVDRAAREGRSGRDDRDRDYYRDRDYGRDNDYNRDDYNRDSRHLGGGSSYRPGPPVQFGSGDSYRPSDGASTFNFRNTMPTSVRTGIDLVNSGNAPPLNRRARHYNESQPYRGHKTNRRPPWRPFVPAERELLSGAHADAPTESLFNANNGVTYRNLDDMSDSGEAEMDISDGDSDSDSGKKDMSTADKQDQDTGSDEPAKKRTRLGPSVSANDNAVPKWSNPDPYTALPPDGASQAKKKDVVQLIRKARVQPKDGGDVKSSIPSEAADYISCDFDDSSDDDGGVPLPQPAPMDTWAALTQPGPREIRGPSVRPPPAIVLPGRVPPPAPSPLVGMELRERLADGPFLPPPLKHETELAGKREPPREYERHGDRKRTHDDQFKKGSNPLLVKDQNPYQDQKGPTKPSDGKITQKWLSPSATSRQPWFNGVRNSLASPLVRLHEEMVDYYNFVRPRKDEEDVRRMLMDKMSRFVRDMCPDADVYAFGSYPSGLYLPTADMDMAFLSDNYRNGGAGKYNSNTFRWKLKARLEMYRMAYNNNIEVIGKAKVPLIKYMDAETALKVDISFENDSGIIAIDTFNAWKKKYPSMPVLVTMIKQFLAMRGLNEPVNGGIGGFTVTCLVVSMLQHTPELMSGSKDARHVLGESLLHFFDLYGNKFMYKDLAISVDPPKYIPKNEVENLPYQNYDRLSVIDPHNPSNDISGGSKNYHTVVEAFRLAYQQLTERLSQVDGHPDSMKMSVLSVIIGGNYDSWYTVRRHIEKVARTLDKKGHNQSRHHTGH